MRDLKITDVGIVLSNGLKYWVRSTKGFDSLEEVAQLFLNAAQVSKVAAEKQSTDESKP